MNIADNLKKISLAVMIFGALQSDYLRAEKKTEHKTCWEASGAVKDLYETPFGTVYQFPFSECAPWIFAENIPDKHQKKSSHRGISSNNDRPEKPPGKITTLEFALPDFKGKSESQYMIVEFALRVFPAVSKIKNPNSHIGFGVSGLKGSNAENYSDLLWMDELHSGSSFSGYLFNNCNICGSWGIGKVNPPLSYIITASETPYYNPEKYRFVFSFDGPKEGSIPLKCYSCSSKKPTYRFVIFIPTPPSFPGRLDMETPRNIIEISEPSVKFSEKHPDEVENKSPNQSKKILNRVHVQALKYPYGSYTLPAEKITKLKNPDHSYACALKLQEYDPPQAQEIFETLADGKSKHVLAMYKTGIGYWRGIGVEPDQKKAREFLNKAVDYGLPEALATLEVMTLKDISVEPRMGLSSADRELVKKINATCISKYDDELSFIVRLLRLDNYNRNRPTNDVKNQLMVAVGINGTPLLKAWEIFPKLNTSANFFLAYGIKGIDHPQSFFERGVKIGSIECELELMRLKVKAQQATAADFTEETDLKFADYPQYYALKNAVLNGKASTIDDLLKINKNLTSYDNDFDAAVAVLYNFYTGDFRNSKSKLFLGQTDRTLKKVNLVDMDGKIKKTEMRGTGIFDSCETTIDLLLSANKKLNASANQGNKDAIYLLALQYLNGQGRGLQTKIDNHYMQMMRARNLFQTAAEKGHLKAKFMLLRLDFETKSITKKEWLTQLEKFQKLNYAPAWLLAAQILEKLAKNEAKYQELVIPAYERAAELGENLANYRLGTIFYRLAKQTFPAESRNGKIEVPENPNAIKALAYWKKYIDNDNRERELDPFDYYSRAAEKNKEP